MARTSAVVKAAAREAAARKAALARRSQVDEVELLRQRIIVELLRQISWEPEAVAAYVRELVQHQALTHEVVEEVRALFAEKGLANIGGAAAKAAAEAPQKKAAGAPAAHVAAAAHCAAPVDAAPAPASKRAAASSGSSSRFDEEFERLELLGRGAFGEVWRVRSRVDLKEYAVKVVPYTYSQEVGPFEHPALREARAWADLKHTNAVRYHAAWVEVQHGGDAAAQAAAAPAAAAAAGRRQLRDVSSTSAKQVPSRTDEAAQAADWEASYDADIFFESCSDDGGVIFAEATVADSEVAVAKEAEKSDEEKEAEEELRIVRHRPAAAAARSSTSASAGRATLYLQTELVRGGTLREWIDRRNAAIGCGEEDAEQQQQLSAQAAEAIFRQLVDVVADLHSRGIAHRDIKPANVMLTENGSVRLGDFGLAKHLGGETTAAAAPTAAEAAVTAGTEVVATHGTAAAAGGAEHTRGVGTPAYASPEQMSQAQYGVEADIFALGVILLELLVPVHSHMERAQLLEGFRVGRLPERADAFCAGASEVVLRMASRDPQQRPSAKELSDLLRQRMQVQESEDFPFNKAGIALGAAPLCSLQRVC